MTMWGKDFLVVRLVIKHHEESLLDPRKILLLGMLFFMVQSLVKRI